jgi:hypothetical protein
MGLSFHRIIVVSLLLAAVLLLPGREARADELFVMPYSCKVAAGGRLLLMPSEDQGHPVIGRRQQEEFRACSPANPGLCRRWNIHRFSLDCGGTRVPWIDVAAAVAAQEDGVDGTRAFVSGGHFELEMPPSWSLAPDDPCSRPGDADPWNGGVRRFCADRLARTPPVTVTMPRGFAPMLGIDGIFVADSARGGAMAEGPRRDPGFDRVAPREGMAETPWRGEPADERRGPAPRATWNESERAPPPPQREAAAPPLPPLPEKKPSPPAPKAPAVAEAKPAVPKAQPTPAEPPASRGTTLAAPPREEAAHAIAPKSETPSGGETAAAEKVVPTIINGDNGSSAEQNPPANTERQNEPQTTAPTGGMAETMPAASDAVSPSSGEMPAPNATTPLEPAPSIETTAIPVTFTSVLSGDNKLLYGVGGAALLSLLVLAAAFMRRGQGTHNAPLARDFASVSFDAAVPAKAAEPTLNALTVVSEPGAREVALPPDNSAGPPALIGDAIPRTREEALRVLGIGVTPDVNEAAIKKIIDGLRISWHPDHASDAEDRKVRELRVRQINVAWDILANRGAAQL